MATRRRRRRRTPTSTPLRLRRPTATPRCVLGMLASTLTDAGDRRGLHRPPGALRPGRHRPRHALRHLSEAVPSVRRLDRPHALRAVRTLRSFCQSLRSRCVCVCQADHAILDRPASIARACSLFRPPRAARPFASGSCSSSVLPRGLPSMLGKTWAPVGSAGRGSRTSRRALRLRLKRRLGASCYRPFGVSCVR